MRRSRPMSGCTMFVVPRRFSVVPKIAQRSMKSGAVRSSYHQRDEAFIFTPAAGGGAQPTHLLMGRHDPVGVHRSRSACRNTWRARFGIASASIPTADELLPGVVPCEDIVGRANDERWRRAEVLEERRDCRRYARASGRGAGHNSALWLTMASVYSSRRCPSSRRSVSASAAITLGDSFVSRPCSRRTR